MLLFPQDASWNLVRMFKATASVAAALFQWQDRLGSSMKTIKKKKENNASVFCGDNKKWLFVSREFVRAEWLRASHRWVSIKFRHHEGIPSPTWVRLKVEFLSVSNIGFKCNVIYCVSLPNAHMEPGKTPKGFGNGAESKAKLPHPTVKQFLMCHHCALQNLHLVTPLISLVWKSPHSPQATSRPTPLEGYNYQSSPALLSKKELCKLGNYRWRCVPRAVGPLLEVHSGSGRKDTDLSTVLHYKI